MAAMPKNAKSDKKADKKLNTDEIILTGGRTLAGELPISGAKNAVLPLLSAALLARGECIINNVPGLDDVLVMLSVLGELGARGELNAGRLWLDCRGVEPRRINPALLAKLRASNLILGPLLGRFGEAEIGACGGCTIGRRPLDLHFAGFGQLGARILPLDGGYFAFARKIVGSNIKLAYPSVGATENILMAAALGDGQTVLQNAAAEPEIAELAAFINSMGGKISGAGSSTVVVQGVPGLHGAEYTVMPDRIEAGTFLLAGAMCGDADARGDNNGLLLRGARADDLRALLDVLAAMGASVRPDAAGLVVRRGVGRLKPVDVETAPYPGFATDLQPQLVAALALADGQSAVQENVFESRFGYIKELKKLGATIQTQDNCAIIYGQKKLHGANVAAGDLRAGAALVLAALAADGESCVRGVEYIDRGYENFVEKLQGVGADIARRARQPEDKQKNGRNC